MSTGASEMVTVSRPDLDAMKTELRRLRREAGRAEALAAIKADAVPATRRVSLPARSLPRRGE